MAGSSAAVALQNALHPASRWAPQAHSLRRADQRGPQGHRRSLAARTVPLALCLRQASLLEALELLASQADRQVAVGRYYPVGQRGPLELSLSSCLLLGNPLAALGPQGRLHCHSRQRMEKLLAELGQP